MIGNTVMGFVSVIRMVMIGIAEYLFLSHHKEVGVVFCQGGALFYHINAAMRNVFLATSVGA